MYNINVSGWVNAFITENSKMLQCGNGFLDCQNGVEILRIDSHVTDLTRKDIKFLP